MKFAKTLKDQLVVEWHKEYIDYRGLKKHISAVKIAQEAQHHAVDDDHSDHRQAHRSIPAGRYGSMGNTPPYNSHDVESTMSVASGRVPPILLPDAALDLPVAAAHASDHRLPEVSSEEHPVAMSIVYSIPDGSETMPAPPLRPRMIKSKTDVVPSTSKVAGAGFPRPPSISSSRFFAGFRRKHSGKRPQSSPTLPENQTLAESMPSLTPLERKCIAQFDKELDKVNTFYGKLEKDAMLRQGKLSEQLHALENHEILFREHRETETKWHSYIAHPSVVKYLPSFAKGRSPKGKETLGRLNGKVNNWHLEHTNASRSSISDGRITGTNVVSSRVKVSELDPEEYRVFRKLLKKALWEYHRLLELIQDYRKLNLLGFEKALKKFDKVTSRGISDKYMHEKVEACEFFRNREIIESMKNHCETQFAKYFTNGDLKRARGRLRPPITSNSHHISVFRTGVYLGICLPALVDGLFESFRDDTRRAIPWDALLLVYATFTVPLLFTILVGLNVLVWSKARINYTLIFDIVRRRKLDRQQFFELPAFLLSALVCSFWLSFRRVGEDFIASTTWPLIWVAFALILIFNPLPIAFSSSRWWLLRKIGKLLVSGTKPVEFTDFWLGDQFCSLVYTFSNLYFVGCAYQQRWNNVLVNCSVSRHWGLPFALATLPFAVRAIQCVKRYSDIAKTNEEQHAANKPFVLRYRDLINAGKYSTSIVYYAFYFQWRHHNLAHDYSLALFIIFATCYSIYTCSWDIFIDWALFRSDSQPIFLRDKDDLLYSQKWVYYFAIISNILLRFSWVIYLPGGDLNINLRSFIAGSLEMFRRWQWNFYRLEAEQIGNIDAYAAIKDVRLPYEAAVMDDDDDYDDYELHSRSVEETSSRSWGTTKRRSARSLRSSPGKFDGGDQP